MPSKDKKRKHMPYEKRRDYVSTYNKKLYASQRLFRKLSILFINNEKLIPDNEKQTFINSLDDLEQQVFYDWLKKIQNRS